MLIRFAFVGYQLGICCSGDVMILVDTVLIEGCEAFLHFPYLFL